jgi:hypothetical protein
MKKIIIGAVVLGIAYVIVTKVVDGTNKLEAENSHDLHQKYTAEKVEERDKKYHVEDSIGAVVFNGAGLTLAEKKEIWNRSPLKAEMIHKYPDFYAMKHFAKMRIEDTDLRKVVQAIIKKVETKVISGQLSNAAEAKRQLGIIE